jgi:hypothetical protein
MKVFELVEKIQVDENEYTHQSLFLLAESFDQLILIYSSYINRVVSINEVCTITTTPVDKYKIVQKRSKSK